MHAYRQIDRQTCMHSYRHIDRQVRIIQAGINASIQTDRQTGMQAKIQTDRQASKHAGRQIDIEPDIQSYELLECTPTTKRLVMIPHRRLGHILPAVGSVESVSVSWHCGHVSRIINHVIRPIICNNNIFF